MSKALPADALFPTQWGLLNVGQQGGHPGSDINVIPVLGTGPGQVTGAGVRVGVIDDGVELAHPDLAANVDAASSYDSVTDVSGSGSGNPTTSSQSHGTAVAGIIGAVANAIGTLGVAPGATLVAERIPLVDDPRDIGDGSKDSRPTQDQAIARALGYAVTARLDVVNDSWGSPEPFVNNYANGAPVAYYAGIQAAATLGRGGRGTSVVFANGNDRADGANGELSGTLNNRFVIAVAAMDNNGVVSSYSTPGANLLVTAPGGGSTPQSDAVPGNAITTSDRTGLDGYNRVPSPAGDAAFGFNGTSAAAPFVSGVIALMLQANPNLGYRDVQAILAYSARQTDPSASGWQATKSAFVNGGGMHFNSDYGFGLVDAHAAVRLAQSWSQLGYAAHGEANVAVRTGSDNPDGPPSKPFPILKGFSTAVLIGGNTTGLAEHVDLNIGLDVPDASRIAVTLTSPSGTAIVLSPFAGAAAYPSSTYKGGFSFGTDAFWGEKTEGFWGVDVVSAPGITKNPGFYLGATLTTYGNQGDTPNQLIYTDDFALQASSQDSRSVVQGKAGIDTFNAAATSGAVTLDLSAAAGVIGGKSVTLADGTSFSRIIGGDGVDVFTADAADHVFSTGYGQSFVTLGAGRNVVVGHGQDTVAGSTGTGTVFAGGSSLYAVMGTGALTVSGQASSATVFAGAGGGVLFGGSAGGNFLVGGAGTGGTTIVGGGSGDLLFAQGPARTVISAGSGNETLAGGGSTGANVFTAGSGADVVGLGSGNDTFIAGTGTATVNGGAGADLFVFANGRAGGAVLINSFKAASGMRVALQGYAAGEAAADLARAVVVGGSTTVVLSDSTRVTFAGVSQLAASAFV